MTLIETLQAILDDYKAMQELCAQAADALELHLGYDRERILIAKLRKATEMNETNDDPTHGAIPLEPSYPLSGLLTVQEHELEMEKLRGEILTSLKSALAQIETLKAEAQSLLIENQSLANLCAQAAGTLEMENQLLQEPRIAQVIDKLRKAAE